MSTPEALSADPKSVGITDVLFRENNYSLKRTTYPPDSAWGEHGLIDLRLERGGRDLLRIESYAEGYFAAYWPVSDDLERFLGSAESYFTEFEPEQNPDTDYRATLIGNGGINSGVFEVGFTRPLIIEDFSSEELPEEIRGINNIRLLRLDSIYGDLIFDRFFDVRNGIIAISEEGSIEATRHATANFIHATNQEISVEFALKTLAHLPHIKPNPAS
jgi:hypothetical protein